MVFHPIELRIQALTLVAWGIPAKEIAASLGMPERTVQDIYRRARARGYDPSKDPRIKMEYVEDAKRSGRPKTITDEVENSVVQSIIQDRAAGSEKSSRKLADETGISHSSMYRILKRHGYVIAKPTWKPGLTDAAKVKRPFCRDHNAVVHFEYVNTRKRKRVHQLPNPVQESAILASDWPEPTTIALSGPSYAIFGHHQTRDAKPQDSTPCESSQLHDVSGNAE